MSSLSTAVHPATTGRVLPAGSALFRLRFQSLFHPGRGLSFPCDADGVVTLDALSERARQNYLYARAVVGREYASPAVELADA